jgi:hypothetical protein
MDPTVIYRMLKCNWFNPTLDVWACDKDKGFKWVPMVIYITTKDANKDAIVIDDVDKLLGLLSHHVIYCTPDASTRYGNICNKIVDKVPDDVFTIALP